MSIKAPRDDKDPFRHLNPGDIGEIWHQLATNPYLLLQIVEVRKFIARQRMKVLTAKSAVRRMEKTSGNEIHNALDYNLDGAKSAPDLDRPAIMVSVVSGIQRVRENAGDLDVLSVGPRSEIEIFALMAAGFSRERIKGLDLFSYSPYIDVGDMHAMPYADNSFDVVFLGWVLAYSKDRARAAREILRVSRERAVVVLTGDYSSEASRKIDFNYENGPLESTDQLLSLFRGHIGQIYFRHDPEPPRVPMVMTVFEVRK